TGHLDPERGAAVVESIAEGCVQAGCALIGGETAEMPGLYHGDDFDLAGFAIGAVDRSALLPKPCGAGDRLIGLPASGAHSNGYSLIRRVVADAGLAWDDQAPFSGADGGAASLGSALLTPTKIYIQAVLPLIRMGQISALAHITGGGLTENLPRVLGDGVSAEIDLTAFQLPGVFRWLSDTAGIAEAEMLRTFNCGVGMVLVVAEEHVAAVQEALIAAGESPIALGALVPHTPGVEAVQYRGSLFG
ncbi:MAG: phosphoribosylformylglycinamidine cyclo-ligase, partial [Pseudomonadota bacterium]